jgi:hypothetical protein
MIMTESDSESHNTWPATPVIPLPIALYDSNGLLFELYDGGQPHRSFAIRWETLKPIRVSGQRDSDPQRSRRSSEPA